MKVVHIGVDFETTGMYIVLSDGTRIDLSHAATVKVHKSLSSNIGILNGIYKQKKEKKKNNV